MGSINIDNTGSGGAITLSSDGTNLLLGGSAVGGGGADLYAANESSPTAQPSATGANAIAIGDSAVASGVDAAAIGNLATATGYRAFAGPKSSAGGQESVALGIGSTNTSYGAPQNFSQAIGLQAYASAAESTAIGNYAVSSGTRSVALGKSYASGTDSFAAAIANNTSTYGATGANSVAIGELARATATDSVAIGSGAYARFTGAVALGFNNESRSYAFTAGRESTATGFVSTAIGYNVAAYHDESVALGRLTETRVRSSIAFGSYGFGSSGDCQSGLYVLNRFTTDATATALIVNGYNSSTAASSSNQIVLPNNSAYSFHGTIIAREKASEGTDCAAWKIEGLIRREGSAGTTVLVNSATTVLDNTPSWGLALSADTTNGCLQITGTGAASTNIRWVATIHTSEVTYA